MNTQPSLSEASQRLKDLEALTAQRESDVLDTAKEIEKLRNEATPFSKLNQAVMAHQTATYLRDAHLRDLEQARLIVETARGDEQKEKAISDLITRVAVANANYAEYKDLASEATYLIHKLREKLLEVSAKRSELTTLKNNALGLLSYPIKRSEAAELLKVLESRGQDLTVLADNWGATKSFDEVVNSVTPGLDLATARALNAIEHGLSYAPKGK